MRRYEWRNDPLGRGLSSDEEVALAARIQSGDPADALAARNELVEANLGLARWYVEKQLAGDTREFEDVLQEAYSGLIEAATRYRPGPQHHRFSTYAVYWLKLKVVNARRRRRLIRLPAHHFERRMETIYTTYVRSLEIDPQADHLGPLDRLIEAEQHDWDTKALRRFGTKVQH
jgi:RNA polymerase sigma factor (sigma-70 family)